MIPHHTILNWIILIPIVFQGSLFSLIPSSHPVAQHVIAGYERLFKIKIPKERLKEQDTAFGVLLAV